MIATSFTAPVNSRAWWEAFFESYRDFDQGHRQTRRCRELLLEALPETEREYLQQNSVSILDWGCISGEGVDVLAKAFPRCQVAGLDLGKRDSAEARSAFPQYAFIHVDEGQLDRDFDVMIAAGCLEYYESPLEIIAEHLRRCRGFYVVLVPYKEVPLLGGRVAQFREESFPEKLLGFTRVCAKVTAGDPLLGTEQMFLVVYAAPDYHRGRSRHLARVEEREKWDRYYASLQAPTLTSSYYSESFSEELAERVGELFPQGARVMEVGCGGGEQSLALARKRDFHVALVDFSSEALQYARRLFAVHCLKAEFHQEDAFQPGTPEFDLVFNAGVLEHYTLDEQAQFLRAMASRSRRYVLAIVPNRECYWYWIWRNQKSGQGQWPFGKESPLVDLSPAFRAAGLHFLGQTYLGTQDTELFIKDFQGLDETAQQAILMIHRSGLIPVSQTSYLVAALGAVAPESAPLPRSWTTAVLNDERRVSDLTAALSDSLSGRVNAEAKILSSEKAAHAQVLELDWFRSHLNEIESQFQAQKEELARYAASRTVRFLAAVMERLRQLATRMGRLSPRQAAGGTLRWLAAYCPPPARRFVRRHRASIVRFIPPRLQYRLKRLLRPHRTLPTEPVWDRWEWFLEGAIRGNVSQRTAIVFSGTTFTESEGQRPTRIARELARRGVPVLFVYWRWDPAEAVRISQFPGVFCLPIDEFVKHYETLLADTRLEDLRRIFLMEFPHPHLLAIVNFANVFGWQTLYDVIDDWEEFKKQGQAFWYDKDVEKYLLVNADLTTVTHETLRRKMIRWGAERTRLVPNAFEDWTPSLAKPSLPARRGKITLGYFGHLTSSWFDWPLIEATARRHPEWCFQIIGYGCDKPVKECDNVVLLGPVEHAELPAYAKNWDVALIPFQKTPLGAAVDPIKIYEYISLGLPTVVTGMPHLASYPGVSVVETAEEFATAIEWAAGKRLDKTTVTEFLDRNRWSNRVDALLEALEENDTQSGVSLAVQPAARTAA